MFLGSSPDLARGWPLLEHLTISLITEPIIINLLTIGRPAVVVNRILVMVLLAIRTLEDRQAVPRRGDHLEGLRRRANSQANVN
jgi:hypothetical protein